MITRLLFRVLARMLRNQALILEVLNHNRSEAFGKALDNAALASDSLADTCEHQAREGA